MIMQYLQTKHEMFSITVFLCGIVTIMLILFLVYHSYLIYQGYSTNETVKRMSVLNFVEQKLNFMKKWEKARQDKKPFKPAQKSLKKYDVCGDITGDLTDEQVTSVKEKMERQLEVLKKGSYFRPVSFVNALMRIWSPDIYDLDGNTKEISLERRGQALERFEKK